MIANKTQIRAMTADGLDAYLAELMAIPPLAGEPHIDARGVRYTYDCQKPLVEHRRLVAFHLVVKQRLALKGSDIAPETVAAEELELELAQFGGSHPIHAAISEHLASFDPPDPPAAPDVPTEP